MHIFYNQILTDPMKDLHPFLKGFIGGSERDPDMGISFGKDAAGHNKEILLDGLFYKGLCVSPGNFWEDIKSTLWFLDVKPSF